MRQMLRCSSVAAARRSSIKWHHSSQVLALGLAGALALGLRTCAAPVASPVSRRLNLGQRAFSSISTSDEATIYALSTAAGRAAIAVIRISGPLCLKIHEHLCPNKPAPYPRHATVRTLYDPLKPGNVLDSQALLLYFPGPKSATGEDVLELHVHGGPAIVRAVLTAIPQCVSTPGSDRVVGHDVARSLRTPAIRPAEPGDFTRRAFLNNRISLTEAESLGDALAAETEQQRLLSVRGSSSASALTATYEDWRRRLLYARGELEALIDFSEDQHFDESPRLLTASVAAQVQELASLIRMQAGNAVRGELLRSGIKLALLGAPNAGKSSLLNQIVGREAAIVSREEGTTRDVVEVGVDIGGWLVRIGDMAGLRGSVAGDGTSPHGVTNLEGHFDSERSSPISEIENEGMRRAEERALVADLVLVVLSLEPPQLPNDVPRLRIEPRVLQTAQTCHTIRNNLVIVINKSDHLHDNPSRTTPAVSATFLQHLHDELKAYFPALSPSRVFLTSCKHAAAAAAHSPTSVTGVQDPGHIQRLLHGLTSVFKSMTSPLSPDDYDAVGTALPWQECLGASERHRRLLEECAVHLDAFTRAVSLPSALEVPARYANDSEASRIAEEAETDMNMDMDIVIAAESLRAAAECLGRITGRGAAGDVEEVLGVVFEKFCVGK